MVVMSEYSKRKFSIELKPFVVGEIMTEYPTMSTESTAIEYLLESWSLSRVKARKADAKKLDDLEKRVTALEAARSE